MMFMQMTVYAILAFIALGAFLLFCATMDFFAHLVLMIRAMTHFETQVKPAKPDAPATNTLLRPASKP